MAQYKTETQHLTQVVSPSTPQNNASLLETMTVFPAPNSRAYRATKRTVDFIAAASLILCLLPFLAIIACRIKMSTRQQGASAFFGHTRIGKHGKTFQCYKFRTMIPNAETILGSYLANNLEAREEWARDQKLKNDPRITPIGHFLRRTSLDELPQLWNVVRGDMSLVGPRPVVYEELQRYGEDLPWYLAVRPGLTGLWQISGRNDIDYAQRVALDKEYVLNRTLWGDFKILLKTAVVLLKGKGAY
jgi:Undecaprenyl-phosphate galactose phosphotransferase WbaP